jgi:hypothetical protein
MINKLTKPRPHPGASPHIASWDSPYLLIILIRTSKSRFGDVLLTELVSFWGLPNTPFYLSVPDNPS